MDKEELLRELGITPDEDIDIDSVQPDSVNTVSSSFSGPEGEHCLVLDQWDMAHGHDLWTNRHQGAKQLTEADYSDFHGAMFLQAPQRCNCSDKVRTEFMTALLESPDYRVLHATTSLNLVTSEAAAHKVAHQYAILYDKLWNNPDNAESLIMRSINEAIEEASQEADEIEASRTALGMGPGMRQGDASDPLDAAKISSTFKKVKNNAVLRRICELAGKYRLVAQSKQRQKVLHGLDDVVGVTVSGDIAKLVPAELAMLADNDFEDDALRRLIDNQSQSRQYRGIERKGKGPIVIGVDESGSMRGERVANAKAFALAMAWVARHQNRWCCLVGYSAGRVGTKCVLKPEAWDEGALMDWLTHFFCGGTTMDVMLDILPFKWWEEIKAPKGKTDIICITDGEVNVPKPMEDNFNAWKVKERARMVTLIINGYAGGGGLKTVSDEVYSVNSIEVDNNAIGRCLSI